ncbi:hypothetical protein UA08_09507 [Talaromyces atroroseus]|uniref:Ubiquitin-like protease family profile domain-containing protein n=1 Tax=Talaromyces atroroseus TaxID=1441469 RepID=A0A1Q5Q689_TALAT|nr:hypothetical protein UA08_09507 [Talaromyces atroroseus]OKL55222.1 hypothetical protein UA08_09507 [Talaromyces atroroseus]
MDSAISSSQTTPSPSQRTRSLLELSEMFRQLADKSEGADSVPEFRDLFHQLFQEAPAVAQAIAAAIRENIPDPSLRLSLKRKRRQDPSYRPNHPVQFVPRKRQRTDDKHAVDEPMTPESPIPKGESPEIDDALDSTICVDMGELKSVSKHERKPGVHSRMLVIDEGKFCESENSHHSTMPTSTIGEQVESPPVPEAHLTEGESFLDTVHQMVDIVHLLKKYPSDVPRTVHQKILQSLYTHQELFIDSTTNQWSDGRMWMEVLERGSATNRRCTVLNMLEYMGASKWGKRLRELVEKIGLGILISPKIWDYTKRKGPQFNQLVKDFRADTQRLLLFQILAPQVERLVHKGCTDPEALYGALRESNLVSEDELQEMKAKYQPQSGSTSAVTLSKAVDRLTSQVSAQVFNKQKLDANDTISINGSVELSVDLFARLQAGKWLDSWALMAAMHISDRPDFVRYGESVPLDTIGRHGQPRSIKQPFQAWVKQIAVFRKEAEGSTPLIFYCPVNHNNSHFTLLEVNDSEKVIRHYDSLAPVTAINGTKKTRIAALVEDEFGDLGYRYTEAPTPQQRDAWSCGTRVVWNFRRISNGFDIGSWDTVLSSEHMNMDIPKPQT